MTEKDIKDMSFLELLENMRKNIEALEKAMLEAKAMKCKAGEAKAMKGIVVTPEEA